MSDDESDDGDEDYTEALMAELDQIKKARVEERLRKEKQQQMEELNAKEEELLKGNPLLNNAPTSFSVKRRWDDDVVFKNQARGEIKAPKRFINDTIRNDFHRKFLHRYMKSQPTHVLCFISKAYALDFNAISQVPTKHEKEAGDCPRELSHVVDSDHVNNTANAKVSSTVFLLTLSVNLPPIIFKRVVLPLPEGPISARISPGRVLPVIPFNMCLYPS
ncbi:hypothetical protein F2Q70_00023513 [Brassica cretica]|uniref:Cwf15/Cwc15 cell cycle control protein n=1 Tax=Brassica cretica TaxID=69181 RepID=A0A8S9GGQ0_BRACR|nr:hypothetical protein F2Q70_00023513 [Brassica cretica]